MNSIDIHSHFFPMISRSQALGTGTQDAPWLRQDSDDRGMMMRGDQEFRTRLQRIMGFCPQTGRNGQSRYSGAAGIGNASVICL